MKLLQNTLKLRFIKESYWLFRVEIKRISENIVLSAEGARFELAVDLRPHLFSRQAH